MDLVLKYTNRARPIVSLPWAVGKLQGWALEKLPENILTLTRDQVRLFSFTYFILYTIPPRCKPQCYITYFLVAQQEFVLSVILPRIDCILACYAHHEC